MEIFDKLNNWAADKVQTATGEKERKQLVKDYEKKKIEFIELVNNQVPIINNKIYNYNYIIKDINCYRKDIVSNNILLLHDFLEKFGKVKSLGEYSNERAVNELSIPEKSIESKEQYFSEINWSSEEVFEKSYKLGIIQTRSQTREQNISIVSSMETLNLEIEKTIRDLRNKIFEIEKDKEIANIYFETITIISEYIIGTILPELEVVESFFQSLILKNEIIAGHHLGNLEFNNNLLLLKDSQYEKHFQFVKNTFLFYLISRKIFDTPVLSKLIYGNVEERDKLMLQKNKDILIEHKKNINKSLMFKRG